MGRSCNSYVLSLAVVFWLHCVQLANCERAEAWNSTGCGHPGFTSPSIPVGVPVHMNIPVDDPAMFNKFRQYYLFLPPNYTGDVALPLVFYFPSFYVTAESAMTMSKLYWMSGQQGGNFIIVIPQGMNDCNEMNCQNPYPTVSWNTFGTGESTGPMGPTCDPDRTKYGEYPCYSSCRAQSSNDSCSPCISASCVNESLFFENVLDEMKTKFCVDTRRMYVTGMSVGGMMALEIASKYANILAGAVPVASGALVGFWKPPVAPIPLMDIHGLFDDTIPANVTNSAHYPAANSAPYDCTFSSDGFYYTPSYNVTRDIARVNGCDMDNANGWNTTNGSWIPWATVCDSQADFQCGLAFGKCPSSYPLVRCTWTGVHELPFVGKRLHSNNLTHPQKVHAFAKIAWEFLEPLYRPFP
eukprot:m.55239 g.55239  ORF g.55239 m.55239 type:complete len:412 (-) comp22036_c0_seq2:19-1254(-)